MTGASPYFLMVMAIFVAVLFLGVAIYLIRKYFDDRTRRTEEDSVVFQVLKTMQEEISSLREKQIDEAVRLQKDIRESMMESQRILSEGLNSGMQLVVKNLAEVSRNLTEQLQKSQKLLNEQLGIAQKNISEQLEGTVRIISDVRTTLGALEEQARRMKELGEDVSKLQEILKSPKLRGSVGEVMLEDMLRQMLPQENYEFQYRFRSGEKVDAIIKLGGNIIPIDSKFPLESFSRLTSATEESEKKKFRREFIQTVKKRIDEIADRYIKPEEGTYDFALMYIPAENVYYEIILRRDENDVAHEDLYSYAVRRRVVPVSPNSFYAYLVAIAFGLKGFKIEKEAIEMRGRMEELRRSIAGFLETFGGLGRNLDLASRKYEEARRKLQKVETQLELITGVSGEVTEGE